MIFSLARGELRNDEGMDQRFGEGVPSYGADVWGRFRVGQKRFGFHFLLLWGGKAARYVAMK